MPPGYDITEVDAYTSVVHVPLPGEQIKAADLDDAAQALANRTKNHELHGLWDTAKNLLGSSLVYKLKAGGELSLTTATSVIRGVASKISGSFTVDAVMSFTGGATFSSVTTTFNSAISALGAFTASSGASFPAGSVVQFGDNTIHIGNDAYDTLRSTTGPSGNSNVDPWKQDLWIAPAMNSGNKTWSLQSPPGNAVVRTVVEMPTVGSDLLFLSAGGPVIATLGPAYMKTAAIMFNGTSWFLYASTPA